MHIIASKFYLYPHSTGHHVQNEESTYLQWKIDRKPADHALALDGDLIRSGAQFDLTSLRAGIEQDGLEEAG